MSAQEPELEVPEVEELDTPFRRRLVLAVALVAFFGGVVGFAAGDAGAREERIATDAQRASVIAMSGNSAAAVKFYEILQNSMDVSSLQRRGDIAQVWAALLGLRGQQGLAEQWKMAAGQVTDMSVLDDKGKYTNNPNLLSADLFAGPDRAALRQQSAEETSTNWGHKRKLEIGIVTLIAVALTLLGLSLTVGQEIRRYLTWPAALLVGVCAAAFVWVVSRPVPHTPDAAITAVAEGDRLAALYDYQRAVSSYTRALKIRPDYPVALRNRASAVVFASSPERDTPQYQYEVSTSTPQAYRAAISDLNRALRVGGDDYLTLLDLGASYFQVDDYSDSAQMSRRAIHLNPGPPLPWMNLAIELLGEGDRSGARRTYDHAIHIIRTNPDPGERAALFSGALTALEILASQRPRELATVRQAEGALIAAESALRVPTAPSASNATISAFQVKSKGKVLRLGYAYANLPKGGRLAEIVYFRPRGIADWVQRDLNNFESTHLPPSGVAYLQRVDPSCPTAGDYRVDIYADARRLATATTPSSPPAETLIPYDDALDRVELCHPQDWTLSSNGGIDLASPDRRREMTIGVAPLPKAPAATPSTTTTSQVLNRMTRQLSSHAVPLNEFSWTPGAAGTARSLLLPGGKIGIVWASAGADGILRTVQLKYPVGSPGPLYDIANYMHFDA